MLAIANFWLANNRIAIMAGALIMIHTTGVIYWLVER